MVSALLATRADGHATDLVDDETAIGDAGLAISSLHVLKALVRVEDALDIVFDDRTVAEASLHSVGVLVDLVEDALAAKGG